MSTPFYRKSHRAWYLQVGKKQVRLAEDRTEAFRRWHQMMAAGDQGGSGGVTVRQAVEEFLTASKVTASPRTVEWYRMFLGRIVSDEPLARLRPIDVTRILTSTQDWGQNTRHNFVRACKRLTRWAHHQGLVDSDPLASMVKPSAVAREDCLTPEEFARIDRLLPEGPFKDLLVVAWETGMRPQELFFIGASCLYENHIKFPRSQSKGGRPRVVYLGSERAMAVIRRLAKEHPTGPLLRNTQGQPWCRYSVSNAFRRLEKTCGIKTHLGAFRKGYCTQGLKNGVDTVTMASLLGHSNAVMVSRVYAKVYQDGQHMLDAAKKVTSTPSPACASLAQET